METDEKKESLLAEKLGAYVDGKLNRLDPSDPEFTELLPEIQTVCALKLALGKDLPLDTAFSSRLRTALVAKTAAQRRPAPSPWLALAASILILLVPALIYFRASFFPAGEKPDAESVKYERMSLSAALKPFEQDRDASHLHQPFAPGLEEKLNRAQNRWVEARMETVYENYMTERGRRL